MSRAIELAKECGMQFEPRFGQCWTGNVQIESFYRAAYNDGLKRAAEICDGETLDDHESYVAILCADAIRKEISE